MIRVYTSLAFTFFLLFMFFSLATSTYAQSENDPYFKKTWQKFSGICDDALEYVVDDSRTNKSTLEFITLRAPKYIRLLKDAQEVLGVSEATPQFDDINELRSKNGELENEIIQLKRDKITAPESSYNPLKKTRSSIEKSIAKKTGAIAANENQISEIKAQLTGTLANHGINIGEEELEYFLVSAEGDELIRLMTMADNMKRIQGIIEQELGKEPGNLELARIYTGMYLISLDAYSNAHDTAIKHINEYRQKLRKIVNEAKKNFKEAQALRRNASESEYPHLDANINLNQRTLDVANSYDTLLIRRNDNLAKSKNALTHKLKIARNTYKTIKNGSTLISLVNDGSNEYALLINFEMPELKNIYEAGMLNAFADISDRIKQEK